MKNRFHLCTIFALVMTTWMSGVVHAQLQIQDQSQDQIQSHGPARALDAYLRLAVENSKIATLRLLELKRIEADANLLRASYGPQLAATGEVNASPIIHGWGYDEIITNKRTLAAQLSFSQQIISQSNLQQRLTPLQVQAQLTRNQADIDQNTLEQNITEQYIISYGSQLQYDLAHELSDLLKKEDRTLLKLTRAGVFKQTDYLTFTIGLKTQLIEEQQAKQQAIAGLQVLNYLCGNLDTTGQRLADPALTPVDSTNASNGRIGAQRYVLDSLLEQSTALAREQQYKPDLQVFADGGYLSSATVTPYKNVGISVGLRVRLPLYDGHQRQYYQLERDLALARIQTNRHLAERKYQQKTQGLLQQIRADDQLISQNDDLFKYYQALIKANEVQLQTGDVTMTDYLLSIQHYLLARKTTIQYKIDRYLILNQLHHVIEQ